MNSGKPQICSLSFYKRTERNKMSKSINNAQLEMLLEKMMQNADIARGFSKENRQKVSKFWKQLTLSLNSLGPPVKSEFEWKKVWSDQKRYVRKKASRNASYESGTGGGPNKTKKLSSAEEAIFQLLDLKDSVHGVEGSHRYGPPEKRAKTNSEAHNLSNSQAHSDDVPGCSTDLLARILDSESSAPQSEPPSPRSECSENADITQPITQTSSKRSNKKMTNTDLISKEIETQQELCGKLGEILTEIKENNKEMQNCAVNVNRNLERMCELKENKLIELKQHNIKMEKMRKREIEELIETNRKTLELKELKTEVLKRK